MVKPIILISGTSGIGKTKLANKLFQELDLSHKQTTGMIREVVAAESNHNRDPELFTHTFHADNPLEHFGIQVKRIEKAVKACIERCRRENASLIIEGAHLTPELFHNVPVSAFIVLTNFDSALHRERIRSRGLNIEVDDKKFSNIRKIDEYLVSEAKKYGVPVIENVDFDDVLEKVRSLLENNNYNS
jgi:2-phosphoglycerate kinase